RPGAVRLARAPPPLLPPGAALPRPRGRPRPRRFLEQLLDHGGGPLHDLPRRDLVDEVVRQALDAVQIHSFFRNHHQSAPVTPSIRAQTNRYPKRQCSSGMCSKLIPESAVMTVRAGMMAPITVRRFIVSLRRLLIAVR